MYAACIRTHEDVRRSTEVLKPAAVIIILSC